VIIDDGLIMKNTTLIIIFLLFLACSAKRVFKEEINTEKGKGKIITTIIPSDSKSCKEDILVKCKTINLDKYAISFSLVGGKIIKKNDFFIITPSCESEKKVLIINYKTDEISTMIQTIDLTEFIKN
jgi:hypothetical protein